MLLCIDSCVFCFLFSGLTIFLASCGVKMFPFLDVYWVENGVDYDYLIFKDIA